MENRPSYVPPTWTGGRINRWVAARPTRVIVFFALATLVAVGLVVWAAVDPRDYFSSPKGVVALIAVPLILYQAVRYGGRAFKARERKDA